MGSEFIGTVNSLIPVPYLGGVWAVSKRINETIYQVKESKRHFVSLAAHIAELLLVLNRIHVSQKALSEKAAFSTDIDDLLALLNDISDFVEAERRESFIRSLVKKEQRIAQIDTYQRRISNSANAFQIDAFIDLSSWQTQNDEARAEDQKAFLARLDELWKKQLDIKDLFDTRQDNVMVILIAIQRRLDTTVVNVPERRFLSKSVKYLRALSGRQAKIQDWMMTSFDVHFTQPEPIASGGYGDIFLGKWLQTDVVLKVLVAPGGAGASPKIIETEAMIWSKLKHPHILQFLGANIWDKRPFIMTPHLKNGNARDYLEGRENCNRIALILTDDMPLADVPDAYFVELIVTKQFRPPRPDADYGRRGLSDETWSLVEHCWAHDASLRPLAKELCSALEQIAHTWALDVTTPLSMPSSPVDGEDDVRTFAAWEETGRKEADARLEAALEAERVAVAEAERKAQEERDRVEAEKAVAEAERKERERIEAERLAVAEAERKERERIEAERLAVAEAERKERERIEAERLAVIEAERKAQEDMVKYQAALKQIQLEQAEEWMQREEAERLVAADAELNLRMQEERERMGNDLKWQVTEPTSPKSGIGGASTGPTTEDRPNAADQEGSTSITGNVERTAAQNLISVSSISSEDIVVILMGLTGAGKSTFIEFATEQNGLSIGHTLSSQTSEVTAVRCVHPSDGRPVVFVDTPGFDATNRSDIDVFRLIADWVVELTSCLIKTESYLMGPTGAGKSTFIDYATKQNGSSIGHTLSSETSKIRTVRCMHPEDNRPVVFVDTPGFDDTYRSDIEILSQIASWFVEVYKEKIPLAAIVYLHRISDNRMASSPLKNLKMFASMCGQRVMPSVVLGTTMWTEVSKETGTRREEELTRLYWADMIEKGCKVARFDDSAESVWDLVGTLATQEFVMDVSYELVDEKKTLNETAAGINLNAELKRLFADQRKAIRELQEQVEKSAADPVVVESLQKKKDEIEGQLTSVKEQIQKLRIPWRKRIANWLAGGRKARDRQIVYVFFLHVLYPADSFVSTCQHSEPEIRRLNQPNIAP
ncbi:hypothetical protein HWV62_16188 [Athelia sp. TMB]|nr:hypothetical protein HWV62_16188 [Athelia sp. TMB]